jgi:hypothetical protein
MSNFITTDSTPQSFIEVLDLIKTIKSKMPYLTDIDSSSQRLLPKLRDEQVPFAEKCLRHAQNVPAIAPSYIEIDEFKKALELFTELQKVQTELQKLTELINNTIAVFGSDSYVAAISIFKSVRKNADNEAIPQIKSILFDLNNAFERLGEAKPLHL